MEPRKLIWSTPPASSSVFLFNYQGFHGCDSICELEIDKLVDGRIVVVCTELPNNHGTSVTNFAENIATLVCNKFDLDPRKVIWIEHYAASKTHGPDPDWDIVAFDLLWNGSNFSFSSPRWSPMFPKDWIKLGCKGYTYA